MGVFVTDLMETARFVSGGGTRARCRGTTITTNFVTPEVFLGTRPKLVVLALDTTPSPASPLDVLFSLVGAAIDAFLIHFDLMFVTENHLSLYNG